MLQIVQDLRSGDVDVIEAPEPVAADNRVVVRNLWSLISPGTEQAVSRTAGKSMVGKALERPDQVRQVLDKARRDGVASAVAAVNARLDDLMTPGYSSAGVVESVGARVGDIRPGDRVGCVGANHAGHAERVLVPAPLCVPLPDHLDDRWGAFGALGAIAAHGVRVAGVEAGAIVLVVGLGLVGQIASQLVTAAGGRAVVLDPSAERVDMALRLGAVAGTAREAEIEGLVRSLSDGHGADSVVVAAASQGAGPLEVAASAARDRARVSVIGDVKLDVPRRPFFEKELALTVSRSYGPGRYDPAYEEEGRDYPIGYVRWTERRLIAYFFEEVAAGRVRLEDLVTHEFPIERGSDAYDALSDPGRLAILIRYAEEGKPRVARTAVTVPPPRRPGRPRVGLIGPGAFARSTLIPLLEKLDVELAAVAGRSPARAVGVARKAGAGYAASDPAEVLRDDSIDVVVISTRHASHADLTARALGAGKAVFLEKPLAIDLQGVEQVRAALAGGEARLVVDFNRSFAPTVERVRRHFAGRREPLFVTCRVNAGHLPADHWLRDPEDGGGRIVGEGCHFVDLCSSLVGSRLTSIQVATLGAAPLTLPGDNVTLTLRYEDESLATVAYLASGHPGMAKERVEVLGGGRAAAIDDFRGLDLHPGKASARDWLPRTKDKGHAELLAQAFRFFREGGEPPVPYDRLLETTLATIAARDALEQGDPGPRRITAD